MGQIKMTKLEKVIKGLEGCFDALVQDEHALAENGVVMSSWQDRAKRIDAIREAIALLKAQEPRVMTLEEVNALDWDYCYLEQERLPGKEYRGMLGKYIMTCVTWPSITAAKISQGMDNYGKTWRCWTASPTDAQREAIPWE